MRRNKRKIFKKRREVKINIFYLDKNPIKCAEFHFDKHISKMIVESTQMLSTAVWCKNPLFAEDMYKNDLIYLPTHINHPSNKWVRKSLSHFIWLRNLVIYLNEEKKYRFNSGNHKSYKIVIYLPFPTIKNIEFEQPLQCMPEYLHSNDSIVAYRNYYISEEKNYMAKWTKRETPEWWV